MPQVGVASFHIRTELMDSPEHFAQHKEAAVTVSASSNVNKRKWIKRSALALVCCTLVLGSIPRNLMDACHSTPLATEEALLSTWFDVLKFLDDYRQDMYLHNTIQNMGTSTLLEDISISTLHEDMSTSTLDDDKETEYKINNSACLGWVV